MQKKLGSGNFKLIFTLGNQGLEAGTGTYFDEKTEFTLTCTDGTFSRSSFSVKAPYNVNTAHLTIKSISFD